MCRRPRRPTLAATTLATGLLLTLACGQQGPPPAPPAPEVLVDQVQVQDVPLIGEWVGETRGRADIEIRARVQGFLQEIHFREGTEVTKGQLLYSIDKSELLQELTTAQAQLAGARTLLANAEADVNRYRPLAEINAISQRDLDNAVARQEASAAEVEAAEAILRLAEINLSYAEIRSPMDGLIGLSKAKVGDFVGLAPNPVVLNTVSDTDPIHVRFAVNEREYLRFARRLPLEGGERQDPEARIPLDLILADGSSHPYPGFTEYVERKIDASTGTLTIEASFPNPDKIVRPGQYAKVRAVVETLKDALLVPQRAVQELQGQFQVWVVNDDDTVSIRPVQTGRRFGDLWIIREGLAAGQRIVVEGVQRLRDGVTVVTKPFQPSSVDNPRTTS